MPSTVRSWYGSNPASGRTEVHVGGEPVGFILEMEDGFRIYHMGDTALFSDMRLIAERYHPDLVLIPIGGHFVMDPADAAYAVREWLKPAHVIPMHYGTTPLLKGTPEQFRAALGASSTDADGARARRQRDLRQIAGRGAPPCAALPASVQAPATLPLTVWVVRVRRSTKPGSGTMRRVARPWPVCQRRT